MLQKIRGEGYWGFDSLEIGRAGQLYVLMFRLRNSSKIMTEVGWNERVPS